MYIEREIKRKFNKIAKAYPALALVGARQSGKTTFLKEQMKKLNSTYLLFDDPDIKNLFEKDIKKFEVQYLEGKEISILDEVHYCKNAGRKLKYLIDNNKKLWITSSNENILSKEVLSFLVGRVSIIKLYPFSLREFLNSKQQKQLTYDILQRNVWEHITYGGYPKVITLNDVEVKKIILKDLFETMLLKDIAQTFSINDTKSLEEFARYLALSIGQTISYENISNHINLSFKSMKKYFDAMEKSYLIAKVPPFFSNKLKEITKQPKLYFIDTGLRNSLTKTFNTDISGELFENYVFSELIKLEYGPKYWRTKAKAEVDFVLEIEKEIVPIEVKINAAKITKSLRAFIKNYKPKKALVVLYNGKKRKVKIEGCNIFFTDVFEMEKLLKQ